MTQTELYIGSVSMMPKEIVAQLENEDVRMTRAILCLDGYREAYGFNPIARFAFWNDSGSITTVSDNNITFHRYGYHSGIRVFTVS